MKNFIKNKWQWIIAIICLIGFIAIAEDVFHKEIMKGDIVGYDIISRLSKLKFATPVAKFITNFGGTIFITLSAIALVIIIKNKKIKISIVVNLLIATLSSQILKRILQRPRPTGIRLVEVSGYSFPSGHSTVSMAFYGYLIYLIYKNIENKYLKWSLITLLSVLICLIGASRIYLGVHYTTDVLGGFFLSISCLIIFAEVNNCISKNN